MFKGEDKMFLLRNNSVIQKMSILLFNNNFVKLSLQTSDVLVQHF